MNCTIEFGMLCFRSVGFFFVWFVTMCVIWSFCAISIYRARKRKRKWDETWERRIRGIPVDTQ